MYKKSSKIGSIAGNAVESINLVYPSDVYLQKAVFSIVFCVRMTANVKPKVHTIHFMRPCVICVYHESRTSVVACDKLQKKTYRIDASRFTFYCDTCIAGKSQQFFKLRGDKLYSIMNGFNKYV